MVGTTRSGRVTKPTLKAQQTTLRSNAHRSTARGPAKKTSRGTKAKANNKLPATSQPTAASQRPVTSHAEIAHHASPTVGKLWELTAHKPVARAKRDGWTSSPLHLSFVLNANLPTSQDVETITLNLIDHMILPENWNPDLRYNVLSAACFFFATILTGGHTSPTQIANAIPVDPQLVLQITGVHGLYNLAARQEAMKALEVSTEAIRRGYEILHEQRAGFRGIVGQYAERLEALPGPIQTMESHHCNGSVIANNDGAREPSDLAKAQHDPSTWAYEPDASVTIESDLSATTKRNEINEFGTAGDMLEEAVISNAERKRGSENDLDLFELDEFDIFVAENE